MPGKPFVRPSAEQRAAFGAAFKADAAKLAKDLGLAAVQHLQDHPESVVTQTIVQVERDTGAITVLARGVSTLLRERRERAEATANTPASATAPKAEP